MPPSEFTASAAVDPVVIKAKRPPRVKAITAATDSIEGFVPPTPSAATPSRKPRTKKTADTKMILSVSSFDDVASSAELVTGKSRLRAPIALVSALRVNSAVAAETDAAFIAAPQTELVMARQSHVELGTGAPNAARPRGDKNPRSTNDATITPYLFKPADTAVVSTGLAALTRAVRVGRYSQLQGLGPDAQLDLRLTDKPVVPADPYRALLLSSASGMIELSDGVRLLLALTGIDLGESAVDIAQTKWLTAAVLGRLRDTPLYAMTHIARGCMVPDDAVETLQMTLRSSAHAFTITARASCACWLDFLARGTWLRQQNTAETFAELPLAVPIRIGDHTLPNSRLTQLGVGDIVLPDSPWFTCSGSGLVRIGDWQLHVLYTAPAGVEILSLETNMDQRNGQQDTVETDE